MALSISFVVCGMPQGKGRPRFTKVGGFVRTYTPEKTAAYEKDIQNCFTEMSQKVNWVCSEKPLKAQILALFPIPKSTSKKMAAAMLEGKILPAKKPDCDNIEKVVYDALNKLAYKDDSQIVKQSISKKYHSGAGKLIIKLTEIGD